LRTPAQRFLLLRELYLPELALEPVSEWGRGGLRSVEELLQQRPEKKEAVLAQLQRRLQRLADKPDVMRHPLAHRLLLDYLSLETGLRPREELAAHLREAVPHMVHTWEGARASCLVAELLSAKERKALMKSLKGLVVKIAREEHAHLFLLRLLDIVDDTVLSSRLLLQEILREPLPPLLQDRFASRVFLNLLAPASQTHFDESSRAVLQAPGPWVAYPEAVGRPKKDAQLRRSELLRHLLPALIDQLASASDTTTASLLRSLPASAVLTELLRHLLQPPEATSSSGGSAESSAEEEFSLKDLELLIARLVAVLEADQSLLEDKVASRCFKRLIHIFATAKKTRPAVPDLPARLLQSSALHGRLAHWVSRPGAGFVICAFLECEDPAVQKLALQELKPQLETLRNQQNASPAVPLIIAHLSGGKKTADRSAPDGKKSAPVSKKQKNDS
jgi:pumilio family protein 6